VSLEATDAVLEIGTGLGYQAAIPAAHRVDAARAALGEADDMLVVGSSLMVYSGYRFCQHARGRASPSSRSTMVARAPTICSR